MLATLATMAYMICDVRLQQFRSYNDATFTFGAGVNIIVGPNGSGKTNLLESILVLARGSSYRVYDDDLLQFGAEWFRLDSQHVDLEMTRMTRVIKFQTIPRKAKSYQLDGKSYLRLTAKHLLPVVLFEPNHLQLLHGAPLGRRDYLDNILEQTIPRYAGFRKDYRRLLTQRNALLKRQRLPSTAELFPWNLRLGELGALIARSRSELCSAMNEKLPGVYKELSRSATVVAVAYKPQFPISNYESHLLEKMETHALQDAQRGFTAYGPHREDFAVTFDGIAAENTASRGETRTAIIALKIIELQFLEAAESIRGQTPLLLLDDVFSDLDARRRQALTSFLQRYQTFLTTTDADIATKHFKGSSIIQLER